MNAIIELCITNKQYAELSDNLQVSGFKRIGYDDVLGNLSIQDVLIFLTTIMGAGSLEKIISKFMDRKKKDISIEIQKDTIKVDCSNSTVQEVVDLLKEIEAMRANQIEE